MQVSGRDAPGSGDLDPRRIASLRRALLAWYRRGARPLPWRGERDPYRVWVAETMLQQTRVAAAARVYPKFLEAFPDIASLAAAGEEAVLAAWSGLGYYARARALHRAARELAARKATFPDDMESALRLPGVGRYTAAAVLSIARGLPRAAVDGNVVRVLSRLFRLPRPDPSGRPHAQIAERLLDRRRPGTWNEALMELGQTLCLPRAPRCGVCPLARHCGARAEGRAAAYPPRRVLPPGERLRVRLWMLRDRRGRLLLERGAFPYLPHLWLPPIRSWEAASGGAARPAGTFRHAIVRRRFEVGVLLGTPRDAPPAEPGTERRRFESGDLERIGRSSLLTKALRVERSAPARCVQ